MEETYGLCYNALIQKLKEEKTSESNRFNGIKKFLEGAAGMV